MFTRFTITTFAFLLMAVPGFGQGSDGARGVTSPAPSRRLADFVRGDIAEAEDSIADRIDALDTLKKAMSKARVEKDGYLISLVPAVALTSAGAYLVLAHQVPWLHYRHLTARRMIGLAATAAGALWTGSALVDHEMSKEQFEAAKTLIRQDEMDIAAEQAYIESARATLEMGDQ